ncbi:MAG TPA: nucleotidyltransferase family protein [Anaerolineales bacterium]
MKARPGNRGRSTASDVITLYTNLEALGIKIWIDGGWGVDALLGRQTRPHEDIDIVVEQKHVATLRKFLENKGYRDMQRDDTSAWNFVMSDVEGHQVDFHVIVFDTHGDGLYGPAEKGIIYPAVSLTGEGSIGGLRVRCISPEWMVKFHSGYELHQKDYDDVAALCAKFGIALPQEYAKFIS